MSSSAPDMLDSFRQDIRHTVRALRANWAFTTVVVITLALGIGTNAAMFGVVDRLLFRAPPMLRDPATAHRVYWFSTLGSHESATPFVQYARYVDLATATHSFSEFAGCRQLELPVGSGASAGDRSIGVVSASFFDFFDARPELGRYFTRSEDAPPSGQAVVVISDGLWRAQFGARPEVLGSRIQLGGVPYTIIGVTPAGFAGLWPDRVPAAYIPVATYANEQSGVLGAGTDWRTTYRWSWLSVIARRRPSVKASTANAELANAAARSHLKQIATQPRTQAAAGGLIGPRAAVASIVAERGPNASSLTRLATWVGGVSLVVLLIACANVASLLLARSLASRREIAVRLALGVSRSRLLSKLFVESVLLALVAGVVGMAIAVWCGGVLRVALLPTFSSTVVLRDGRTLAFCGVATLVAGMLIGIASMLQAAGTHRSLAMDLRTRPRDGVHRASNARSALLVTQAALSTALLVGAGLFVRSVVNVRRLRLGYDVDPILFVEVRGAKLDSTNDAALRRRLLAAAGQLPGITHASFATALPFWRSESDGLFVQGVDSVRRLGEFDLNAVGPGFFATFGTRVIRGREFTNQDSRTAPRVAIVSEGMARVLWPTRDALGQCVRLKADTMPCTTVVGIAEDIRQGRLTGGSDVYTYYLPSDQVSEPASLILRTSGDARDVAEAMRRALQREVSGSALISVNPYSDIIGAHTRSWDIGAKLFAAFAALALTLASVGLYSVIAWDVAQRTGEMGIRIALGAQARDVIQLVVRQGLVLAAIGLSLGALAALAAAHWVTPLLFQESARDPAVFALVTVLLLAVAVAASWIPARRAAKADPQSALKSE